MGENMGKKLKKGIFAIGTTALSLLTLASCKNGKINEVETPKQPEITEGLTADQQHVKTLAEKCAFTMSQKDVVMVETIHNSEESSNKHISMYDTVNQREASASKFGSDLFVYSVMSNNMVTRASNNWSELEIHPYSYDSNDKKVKDTLYNMIFETMTSNYLEKETVIVITEEGYTLTLGSGIKVSYMVDEDNAWLLQENIIFNDSSECTETYVTSSLESMEEFFNYCYKNINELANENEVNNFEK